jgi:hypothetical protein
MYKPITVKQLKTLLADAPDDALVILARDIEGNAFSPFAAYTSQARYLPAPRAWEPGDITTPNDPDFQQNQGQPAFVLWPAH